MGMQWGPGRTDQGLSGQATGSGGAAGSAACDCNKTCCVPGNEVHYGQTNIGAAIPVWIDNPSTSRTLANRVAIEFKNPSSATNTFEVSDQKSWSFGDGNGRPVAPGESYSLVIGAGQNHYVLCGTGTCDCRVTELGI